VALTHPGPPWTGLVQKDGIPFRGGECSYFSAKLGGRRLSFKRGREVDGGEQSPGKRGSCCLGGGGEGALLAPGGGELQFLSGRRIKRRTRELKRLQLKKNTTCRGEEVIVPRQKGEG